MTVGYGMLTTSAPWDFSKSLKIGWDVRVWFRESRGVGFCGCGAIDVKAPHPHATLVGSLDNGVGCVREGGPV